jgi:DNA-binding MarR family transcriptional regulator
MTQPPRRRATDDPRGEFPLDVTTYVFHLFAVISRHRESQLDERLRPLGLNLIRHRALSVISRLEPCTMSELADFTAVDRTTLTRTVDQLVEAALVVRATPKEDRRQVILTLTPAGRETCTQSLNAIYDHSCGLLEGMAEAQQRAVGRAFEHVVARMIDDVALRRRLTLREPPTS